MTEIDSERNKQTMKAEGRFVLLLEQVVKEIHGYERDLQQAAGAVMVAAQAQRGWTGWPNSNLAAEVWGEYSDVAGDLHCWLRHAETFLVDKMFLVVDEQPNEL